MRIRIILAALVLVGCDRAAKDPIEREIDQSALTVLPALEAPVPAGKSAVWCASFQVAWNRLAKDVVKGPPLIRGAEDLCQRLNSSTIWEADLPEGTFYAAAGWVKDGIRERIWKEMVAAFPSVPKPDLGTVEAGAVAYAYMEAGVKFGIPFFEGRAPLVFKDSRGLESKVTSFGFGGEAGHPHQDVCSQVEVLFRGFRGPGPNRPSEFAIDPCKTSNPVQVILACVPPRPSLGETVAAVEDEIAGFKVNQFFQEIGPDDVLIVPNLVFKLNHPFKELEGKDKAFLNPGMEGIWVEKAIQTIRFHIDRSGVELRSESVIVAPAIPNQFIFDHPFLVYLKKRGGGKPFFALWVDGPELLQSW